MKKLILLTNEFPFGKTEMYLETEIKYLSAKFDEILIFAAHPASDAPRTRKVPGNVKAFALGMDSLPVNRFKYLLRGFAAPSADVKIVRGLSAKSFAGMSGHGRSLAAVDKIKTVLDTESFEGCSVTVYSYWFSDLSLTALRLREYLKDKGNKAIAVTRAHYKDVFGEKDPALLYPYQHDVAAEINAVYACSIRTERNLASKYPDVFQKVKIARFGTEDHGIRVWRGSKSILTCSSFDKDKRLTLFAEAFAMAAKKDRDLKWTAVGDGEELKKVKTIINRAGLEDRVEFLGAMSNPEVIELYQQKDFMLVCDTSMYGDVPVSIIEAFSFGVPALATDAGGTGELIDRSNGVTVKKDVNAEQLSEQLLRFARMAPEDIGYKRDRARATWEISWQAKSNFSRWADTISPELE